MEKATRDLMFSSATEEWSTPDSLIEYVVERYGPIGLDAAATAENAKAPAYYTKEQDALTRPWQVPFADHNGRPYIVWCNPPYGRRVSGLWVAYGREQAGIHGSRIVMLLPARTDTKWFHGHVWDREAGRPRPGVAVDFIAGRLRFGGAPHPAPFPSMLVIFNGYEVW